MKTLYVYVYLSGFLLTLHERMLPKAENVSYSALLSMDLSKFLMNMLPTPLLRRDGSRWDHMIRTGLPFITSKFMVSKARSAARRTFLEYYFKTFTGHLKLYKLLRESSWAYHPSTFFLTSRWQAGPYLTLDLNCDTKKRSIRNPN